MRRDLSSKIPLIGILCWERDSMPRGLVQLERLPGNSANPETFEFPVRYCRIEGANIHTILENPRHNVLQSMIDEAHKMEEQGVRAITTSCGFNTIFQRELTHSLHLPVFTSSLMQAPLVQHMLGKGRSVGVITARKEAFTEKHLQCAGIKDRRSIYIEGLETCAEWNKIFTSPDEDLDIHTVKNDVVHIACSMMETTDIGAYWNALIFRPLRRRFEKRRAGRYLILSR